MIIIIIALFPKTIAWNDSRKYVRSQAKDNKLFYNK